MNTHDHNLLKADTEHDRFSELPSKMFTLMWTVEEKRREVVIVIAAIVEKKKLNDTIAT